MTRKHYEKLARILATLRLDLERIAVKVYAQDGANYADYNDTLRAYMRHETALIAILEAENANFSKPKFISAIASEYHDMVTPA